MSFLIRAAQHDAAVLAVYLPKRLVRAQAELGLLLGLLGASRAITVLFGIPSGRPSRAVSGRLGCSWHCQSLGTILFLARASRPPAKVCSPFERRPYVTACRCCCCCHFPQCLYYTHSEKQTLCLLPCVPPEKEVCFVSRITHLFLFLIVTFTPQTSVCT